MIHSLRKEVSWVLERRRASSYSSAWCLSVVAVAEMEISLTFCMGVRFLSTNVRDLFCLMSLVSERSERVVSFHHTNASGNRAQRFDAEQLTSIWHLILHFSHLGVADVVRCTPPQSSTPQYFIDFVRWFCTIHIPHE